MPREDGYKNLGRDMSYRYIYTKKGDKIKVDREDYDWLVKYRWRIEVKKSGLKYACASINGNRIYMHRLIMGVQNISFKTVEVDHRDGNGINNTRKNLRKCTRKENMLNTKSRKGSSSKYKHVIYNKYTGKYDVQFVFNGELMGGGSFRSEEVAGLVANVLMEYYHKEFARLNDIADIINIKEYRAPEAIINPDYLEYDDLE